MWMRTAQLSHLIASFFFNDTETTEIYTLSLHDALADLPRPEIDRKAYSSQHHLDAAKPWITVMPGSRVKEVRMNLPPIVESAAKLGPAYEFLLPVAPTLDRSFLLSLIGDSSSIH